MSISSVLYVSQIRFSLDFVDVLMSQKELNKMSQVNVCPVINFEVDDCDSALTSQSRLRWASRKLN